MVGASLAGITGLAVGAREAGAAATAREAAASLTARDAVAGATDRQQVVLAAVGTTPDWINVTSTAYRADPTGASDSTAAIQNAINAAGSAPAAGVVYFPAGTYRISAAMTVHSNLTLIGDGDGQTMITQASGTADGLYGAGITRLRVHGIWIQQGASGSAGSGPGVGINLDSPAQGRSQVTNSYCAISDVTVSGFGADGISIGNPVVGSLSRVVSQLNGRAGISLHGTAGASAGSSVTMDSCHADSNNGAGFELSAMAYCFLNGCASDQNGYGYQLTSCRAVALTGCGAQDTVNDSFVLSGGAGNTLTSCLIDNNQHYGIHVTGGEAACTLTACVEYAAAGAQYAVLVDSGSSAACLNCATATGSEVTQTTILSDAAGQLSVAGPASLSTASLSGPLTLGSGASLTVPEGANARMGTAALRGTDEVSVETTAVTAKSRVFLTIQSAAGTPGTPYVAAVSAGRSFLVKSTSPADRSEIAWFLIDHT
jgi:hypothetical protein